MPTRCSSTTGGSGRMSTGAGGSEQSDSEWARIPARWRPSLQDTHGVSSTAPRVPRGAQCSQSVLAALEARRAHESSLLVPSIRANRVAHALAHAPYSVLAVGAEAEDTNVDASPS